MQSVCSKMSIQSRQQVRNKVSRQEKKNQCLSLRVSKNSYITEPNL